MKDWIKQYYSMGFYTKEQVRVFVTVNMITSNDYAEITGEPY